jgi:hypothetical protein
MLASTDADGSEKANEANGCNADAASNDASVALKAVLKNLPKLTANERYIVRMELELLDEAAAAAAAPSSSQPSP